jgi:hypothetical protein
MLHTDRWFTVLTVICISNKQQDSLCITSDYTALCTATDNTEVVKSKAAYTLSVKLGDFTVWRHTWGKNWVNCAVLTGNSEGLRTVPSSRLSHRELRNSLRESHSFLSLPADTTMASYQGTPFLAIHSADEHHMIYSFSIPLITPHFTLSFLFVRITIWPMWLANSKRQPCFYRP